MSYEMYRAHFEGESFNELLVEQLRRAPWVVVSLAVHVALGLVLSFFLTEDLVADGPPDTTVAFEDQEDVEPDDEEIEPEPEEPEPDETQQEVETEDVKETDIVQTDDDVEYQEENGTEGLSDAFDDKASNDAIGLGASGFMGRKGRPGKGGGGPPGGSPRGERAVLRGLEWLARHQSPDGRWDADGFVCDDRCEGGCGGKGGALHDVGVTGLSLLAFLGANHTHRLGEYKKNVKKGLSWLVREMQDAEGCFGPRTDRRFTYNHAIAALALCEAYGMTKSSMLKEPAQKAIDFCVQCQNPYKAWRYGEQPGDNDTSVTGWMVMVLKSAEYAGLRAPQDSMKWALSFVEEMTDEENGRTGYVKRGEIPVREEGKQEAFPSTEIESMTAAGMLCRIFAGQDPAETAEIKLGAELLRKKLPDWDVARGSIDMYYWYYGSLVAYQVNGPLWKDWNRAMQTAVIDSQRTDGGAAGSWDPIGAWGEEGGRVYSTAMLTMCLEVYYRYGRVFGVK